MRKMIALPRKGLQSQHAVVYLFGMMFLFFIIDVNAQPLTWIAAPSPTNNIFSTQAEALNDLHAFGPQHALLTELISTTQNGGTITYRYKIPDADPIVGNWVYTPVDPPSFPTEAEAFDALLQSQVDLRMAGEGGCPPYAVIFPATEPPGFDTWKNYNHSGDTILGISRKERKFFSGEFYANNVVDHSGLCQAFSPVTPPGSGFLWIKRARSVTCPQYFSRNETVGKCTSNLIGNLYAKSQYYLEPPKQKPDCEREKNPCHPTTGNKSQQEIDRSNAGLHQIEFARYYNSLGYHISSKTLSPGWRHTFDRRLNESILGNSGLYIDNTNQSSLYTSPSDACTQGWQDIKNTVWNGVLAGATASYIGNQKCRINLVAKKVAIFSTRPTLNRYVPLTQPSPFDGNVMTLTRPNGHIYHFEYFNGTIWNEPFYPEVTLEYSGTDWLFTDTDKTQERFDDTGKLLSVTDVRDTVQTLTYDTNDRLDRVDSDTGEFIQFTYDTADRISTITDHSNRIWTYRYDTTGNLEFVDNPDGTTKQYHYEDPNFTFALTGITDERQNRYATWAYNADGKAILSEHAGTERVDLTYNPDGTTTVTGSRGDSRTYHFAPQQGQLAVTQITGNLCTDCPNGDKKDRSYDANGYLSSYTDWSNAITEMGNYDAIGQLGFKIEAKGTPDERRSDYSYDPRFNNKTTTITAPSVFSQ